MSDILSYARLLALGLATGVISASGEHSRITVWRRNRRSSCSDSDILMGHTMNLAINVLGAFIHSSRLQYVGILRKVL